MRSIVEEPVSGPPTSVEFYGQIPTLLRPASAPRSARDDALSRPGAVVLVQALQRAVAARDGYTAGHQSNVAELCLAIGRILGMSGQKLAGLGCGASIHDVGKLGVPMAILAKRGELTDPERAIVETHAQTGHGILAGIAFPWPLAQMVLQHHERLDGSGYPSGLRGDAILMEARIIAVADVVEAMTLARPYRRALGLEAALEEVRRGRGQVYDPAVVDACLRVFADTPFAFSAHDQPRRRRAYASDGRRKHTRQAPVEATPPRRRRGPATGLA